jgi:predicted Zn finger-like uncharacterized protein
MASGLATRCSACGTVFRVVPDQLRVSDGWVRCGRCSEVFNAAEALLDLETGAPRRIDEEAPPAPPPPTPPRAMVQFTSSLPVPPPPPEPAAVAFDPEPGNPRFIDEPLASAEAVPVVDDAESRFPSNETLAPGDIAADPRPKVVETPSFVRQAEQAARWRQPRVRAALAVVGVLAVFGLVAQVALEYRDLAAARFPSTRPLLQQACETLGCTIGPARVIDGLAVESSGLVRVEKSNVYKLSVALRNRAALDIALPALEPSLTDSQGKLVARRVLNAGEFGVNQATLAAGRELALQATLQASTAPVAGYTIELFYP